MQKILPFLFTHRRAVTALSLSVTFLICAYLATQRKPWMVEPGLLLLIYHNSNAALNPFVVQLTHTGTDAWLITLVMAVAVVLVAKRYYQYALFLLVTMASTAVVNLVLKALFQRARPELWTHLVYEPAYSFPSGHAMGSSALALVLVIIFWRTRWRKPVVIGAILYVLAIGATRLYLGVHYPSDIIGGWCASALVVWGAWLGVRFASQRIQSARIAHRR